MREYKLAGGCCLCGQGMRPDQYYTEINPPGGYDRDQYIVCDDCMKTPEMDDWKRRKWTNWPNEPIEVGEDD